MRFLSFARLCFLSSLLSAPLLLAGDVRADDIKVRFPQGTLHGFLVLRTQDEKTIATGDLTELVHGDHINLKLKFNFKDGSVDDDEAEYTQHGVFRLLRERHIQSGPSYPHPSDLAVDVASGMVTTREKKGSDPEKVETKHMDLPPDLSNGLLLIMVLNILPDTPKSVVPYLVPVSGSPRLVHLGITPGGTQPFRAGKTRTAQAFSVHFDIGGVTGVAAKVVGQQPKDVGFLVTEDNAPSFVREEGQLFQGGPVWRIEQVGPEVRGR